MWRAPDLISGFLYVDENLVFKIVLPRFVRFKKWIYRLYTIPLPTGA